MIKGATNFQNIIQLALIHFLQNGWMSENGSNSDTNPIKTKAHSNISSWFTLFYYNYVCGHWLWNILHFGRNNFSKFTHFTGKSQLGTKNIENLHWHKQKVTNWKMREHFLMCIVITCFVYKSVEQSWTECCRLIGTCVCVSVKIRIRTPSKCEFAPANC